MNSYRRSEETWRSHIQRQAVKADRFWTAYLTLTELRSLQMPVSTLISRHGATPQEPRVFRKMFIHMSQIFWLHLNNSPPKYSAWRAKHFLFCLFNGLFVEAMRSMLVSQTRSRDNSNNLPPPHPPSRFSDQHYHPILYLHPYRAHRGLHFTILTVWRHLHSHRYPFVLSYEQKTLFL